MRFSQSNLWHCEIATHFCSYGRAKVISIVILTKKSFVLKTLVTKIKTSTFHCLVIIVTVQEPPVLFCFREGGAVRVQDLAGDITLCSWARHLTLTVPPSTQVYKWVPAN